MKVKIPIGIYADFECINQSQDSLKVQASQHLIALGIILPFGVQYFYSKFVTYCVKWFVKKC